MSTQEKVRILFVDDVANLLQGVSRQLRNHYDIYTATSGYEGLDILKNDGPFPVVVSDMKMPNMNGAEFLIRVSEMSPETVTMLLTGHGDFEDTIRAVNKGHIFRLIQKPCCTGMLIRNLEDAIEQYRLVEDQQVLLERTLSGSIKVLTEVLALAHPIGFGRALRAKKTVMNLACQMGFEAGWEVKVAAMLSQISAIALPYELAEKIYQGNALTEEEQEVVKDLPRITDGWLQNIPRIEPVREIIKSLHFRFDNDYPNLNVVKVPMGVRLLQTALDFDYYLNKFGRKDLSLEALQDKPTQYDTDVLEALRQICDIEDTDMHPHLVDPKDIQVGMVFYNDLCARSGKLLVAHGQGVNESIKTRVQHWHSKGMIGDEVLMLTSDDA